MYTKSIVASGHQLVSNAAAMILEAGGNAFDAVVAAGFASAVAEPALTSLGGGGFMLGHNAQTGQNIFFDFFVDTPGRGRSGSTSDTHFFAVTVDFSGTSQDFNIGLGSAAVPGTLKGLLHIHKRLGRMPLADVISPARDLAKKHRLNVQQAHFLKLLHPIMTLTDRGKAIYAPGDHYLQAGDNLVNGEMVGFLDELANDGADSFYQGEIAGRIDEEMRHGGGLLTREDLELYRVIERPPLTVPYKGFTFLTAPEPSMGGTLIALSISLRAAQQDRLVAWGSGEHLLQAVGLMREVERLRGRGISEPEALQAFLRDGRLVEDAAKNARMFSRGTTHVSIADKDGNCASMTCSNGEGSGYFAPGTGVMLNNMMGEDDLHPHGFHTSPPGERVFSMMSPSLLMQGEQVKLVIGSGGSKRIRIAVSQVMSQIVDFGRPLQVAVDAPRVYLDEDCVQVEPGFSADAVAELARVIPVNLWDHRDVYFGGVHAVMPGVEGAGDSRRGGAVVEVER